MWWLWYKVLLTYSYMGIKQNTATILAFTSFLSRFEATVTQITQGLNEWKLYHFCAFSWFWVWPNTIYLGDILFGWCKNIFDWRQKYIWLKAMQTYICFMENIYLFQGKDIFVLWQTYIWFMAEIKTIVSLPLPAAARLTLAWKFIGENFCVFLLHNFLHLPIARLSN